VPDGYLRGTAAIDTADGTFAYTWNGENRLIRAAGKNPSSAADKKLEFAYDYLGRRVPARRRVTRPRSPTRVSTGTS
jgi:hypothetical protein